MVPAETRARLEPIVGKYLASAD